MHAPDFVCRFLKCSCDKVFNVQFGSAYVINYAHLVCADTPRLEEVPIRTPLPSAESNMWSIWAPNGGSLTVKILGTCQACDSDAPHVDLTPTAFMALGHPGAPSISRCHPGRHLWSCLIELPDCRCFKESSDSTNTNTAASIVRNSQPKSMCNMQGRNCDVHNEYSTIRLPLS